MAFQSKRTFELIDPSTFDSEAALRKAAKEYYRDLTFDGDDEGLEEDIWLARRPAACDPDKTIQRSLSMPSLRSAFGVEISPTSSTCSPAGR